MVAPDRLSVIQARRYGGRKCYSHVKSFRHGRVVSTMLVPAHPSKIREGTSEMSFVNPTAFKKQI